MPQPTLQQLKDFVTANPGTTLRKYELLFRFDKNAQGQEIIKGAHIAVIVERPGVGGENTVREFGPYEFNRAQILANDAQLRSILTDVGIAQLTTIADLNAQIAATATAHTQALATKDTEKQAALTGLNETIAQLQADKTTLQQSQQTAEATHASAIAVEQEIHIAALAATQTEHVAALAGKQALIDAMGGTVEGLRLARLARRQAAVDAQTAAEAEVARKAAEIAAIDAEV